MTKLTLSVDEVVVKEAKRLAKRNKTAESVWEEYDIGR